MSDGTVAPADVMLCFDANLPKMSACCGDCFNNPMLLCHHRFHFKAHICYCNTKPLQRFSDLNIVLHFFRCIDESIEREMVSANSLFVIVTHDTDFLKDAEREYLHSNRESGLVFTSNHVRKNGICVFVKLVDCKNYGRGKIDDLRCIIFKMNKFFRRMLDKKAS